MSSDDDASAASLHPTVPTRTLRHVLTDIGITDGGMRSICSSHTDLNGIQLAFFDIEDRNGVSSSFKKLNDGDTMKMKRFFDWWVSHQTLHPATATPWDSLTKEVFQELISRPYCPSPYTKSTGSSGSTNNTTGTFHTNDTREYPRTTTEREEEAEPLVPPTVHNLRETFEAHADTRPPVSVVDPTTPHVTNVRYAARAPIDLSQDTISHHLRSYSTASVDSTLQPHPLWVSPFATTSRSPTNTKTFYDSKVTLANSEPDTIINFYRHLCETAHLAQIDLCPLAHCDATKALWPRNRASQIVYKMDNLLVVKLLKEDVLNREDPTINLLVISTLVDNDSQLKGYEFLHKLLRRAYTKLQERMPTQPRLSDHASIAKYGSALIVYYSALSSLKLQVPHVSQSKVFCTELQENGINVDTYQDRLSLFQQPCTLPSDLLLEEIVLKVSDTRKYSPNPVHIHRVVQANAKGRPSLPDLPFRQRIEAQCNACGIWGHNADSCRMTAIIASSMKYIQENAHASSTLVKKWVSTNAKQDRVATIRQLQSVFPDRFNDLTDSQLDEALDSNQDFCTADW